MAGKPYVDKGEVVTIDPPRLLVHTHWSDLSGKLDSPENYQEVRWALSERDGATQLTITEHNLPSQETKAVSEESWKTVLNNLKELLADPAKSPPETSGPPLSGSPPRVPSAA